MKANPILNSVLPVTPEDIQAITKTSHDYTEGWFTASEERVRRSLHPQLVKRTVWHDLQKGTWKLSNPLGAEAMVYYTCQGGGSALPEPEKTFEIVILDAFHNIATVRVVSYPYVDYLHLAKTNDHWQIVNCLYDVRTGENTTP